MMDTIYNKAQPVFAWLGPESEDSRLAMATLGASSLREQPELPEEVETACDAVIRLLSRPYFRRTWIIQEICRGAEPDSHLRPAVDSLGDDAEKVRYARQLDSCPICPQSYTAVTCDALSRPFPIQGRYRDGTDSSPYHEPEIASPRPA